MHTRKNQRQSGFTLLEMLLVIGIGSFIFLGFIRLTDDFSQQIINQNEASYLIETHDAAENYVQTNFTRLLNSPDLTGVGDVMVISFQETASVNFSLKSTTNDPVAVVNDGYPEQTISGRDINIYIRNLGDIGDMPTLEILTMTFTDDVDVDNPKTQSCMTLLKIANFIGPKAGIYYPGGSGNQCPNAEDAVRGVYGNWRVPIEFIDGNGSNTVTGQDYDPDIDITAGYPAYIGLQSRVSLRNSVNPNYLYRSQVAGLPQLNRMETDLNMAGFNLNDINIMTADNFSTNANLEVIPDTGSATPADFSLNIDETLTVSGQSSVEGDIVVSGSRLDNPATPNDESTIGLTVGSELNAINAIVTANEIIVEDQLRVGGNLLVERQTDIGGDVGIDQAIVENMNVLTELRTNSLQLSAAGSDGRAFSSISTGAIAAGSLDLRGNGSLVTTSLDVLTDATGNSGGDLIVGGELNLSNGLSADQVSVDNLDNNGEDGCRATIIHEIGPGINQYRTVDAYDCNAGPQ